MVLTQYEYDLRKLRIGEINNLLMRAENLLDLIHSNSGTVARQYEAMFDVQVGIMIDTINRLHIHPQLDS